MTLLENYAVSVAATGLPINSNSSPELRMDWRYLDLRNPKNLLIFELQTVIEHAMREYWMKNGFIEIHTPKLEEEWIAYFMVKAQEKLWEKVTALYGITIEVPKLPFPRISLAEAKEIIRERGYVSPKDDDLNPEDEKILSCNSLHTELFLMVVMALICRV